MIAADIIKLIGDNPHAHGIYDEHGEILRDVFCEVKSVGMREAYQAMSLGLSPSYVFVLQLAADYEGEHELIFRGERYKVLRTYVTGDGIELTCERVNTNV